MINSTPDSSQSNRFLFLVHRVPFPPDKGDRIRSYHVLKHLASRGRVDLAYLTDESVSQETSSELKRLCHRVEAVRLTWFRRWFWASWSLLRGQSATAGFFSTPQFRVLVQRWLGEIDYDAIVCFSSGVLPAVLGQSCLDRLIVDLVDVDSQKWFDYARRSGGLKAFLFGLEGRRVRLLEQKAGRARAVVLATEPEAQVYRQIDPQAVVEVIPNGVDLEYFAPRVTLQTEGQGGCVFVGQLDYRANVLSLEWFCREVWPLIRTRCPDATLSLVGRQPTRAVRALAAIEGIAVVGSVPDVRPYLVEARLVLVPLLVARGVQNKVLEAMAMGRTVIASPEALEGLAPVPDRDVIRANGPEAWVRVVAQLWGDASRRDQIGQAARNFVLTQHRWQNTLRRFDAHLGVRSTTTPLDVSTTANSFSRYA